jgi:uncharacterized OB-fold protein
MTARPVTDGLFTWPGEPRLLAGGCDACGTVTFPRQDSCPRCTGTKIHSRSLSPRGRLWSWTVQGFEPKSPFLHDGPFEPYGVGYVELDAAVLVEARLTVADPDRLHIGDDMDLVIVPFAHDAAGAELLTFAFAPAAPPSE